MLKINIKNELLNKRWCFQENPEAAPVPQAEKAEEKKVLAQTKEELAALQKGVEAEAAVKPEEAKGPYDSARLGKILSMPLDAPEKYPESRRTAYMIALKSVVNNSELGVAHRMAKELARPELEKDFAQISNETTAAVENVTERV